MARHQQSRANAKRPDGDHRSGIGIARPVVIVGVPPVRTLDVFGRIGEVAGEIPGGGGEFHLIVLQHTDCGITRLASDPAMLTRYFQIQEAELRKKKVTDPRAAVAVDVALLRAIPELPSEWQISGLVYDVATGLVEIVVPPALIRAA